ncbi:MAG TPA: cell division protein FtsH, partial [Waddliaceae bacterium]
MANDKKLKPDQKKNFPTTFFLFLLAIILIVITIQNFMTNKSAKVAFSHQVEHLVNLNLIIPEENRKVSLNDNLVSFSGKFRESESDEGRKRYKYLELLNANHNLQIRQEEIVATLTRLQGEIREAGNWFLEISGEPIPQGGYRIIEETYDLPKRQNAIVIKQGAAKEMINLRMLQNKLAQLNASLSGQLSPAQLQAMLGSFESDLTILIGNFRSPVLGIGAESMKQELKTLEKNIEDVAHPSVPLATKIATYTHVLAELQSIIQKLDQPVDNIHLSELRS